MEYSHLNIPIWLKNGALPSILSDSFDATCRAQMGCKLDNHRFAVQSQNTVAAYFSVEVTFLFADHR